MKKSTKSSTLLLKYSALFLFGVSAVYFASAYTSVNTALTNAVQYIQKVVLTSDGNQSGTTGIVLDGLSGSVSASLYCDANGVNCKSVLTMGATGAIGATGAVGATGASGSGAGLWNLSGNNIYYNSGNVGIGTTNPQVALEVSGSIRIGQGTSGCTAVGGPLALPDAKEGTIVYSANHFFGCIVVNGQFNGWSQLDP